MTNDSAEAAARRFLDVCARLEKVLQSRFHPDGRGFGAAIKAGRKDPTVRRNSAALDAFRELRNVLSHEAYQNGAPIATPLESTVVAAEKLLGEFEHPTLALTLAAGKPLTAQRDDPIAPLLLQMAERDISQIPVLDSGRVLLLTTNAVARWVAAHIETDGSVLIEAATVADILIYSEPHEWVKVAPRGLAAAGALEALTADEPPAALLLTHSGAPTEKPLGILVRADAHALASAVTTQP